jgi:N-acetylglucosaminyldiphosphoundecaprenol N-acetyl-beta-D-mannosaminyltransferase
MDLKFILSNKVFTASLSEINIEKRCIINTINPHSYCVAKKDKKFEEALMCSDILLPDGVGIVLANRIMNGNKIRKISGADIHDYLLEKANNKKLKIFYLGASDKALNLIEKRVLNEFPEIQISSFSPPFKSEFSDKETNNMIDKINSFNPDILFVGMTAPKQEKWVNSNKENIDATVVASIGAVFDFYAGLVKRSGPIWIKMGLEWLPRLLKEPKRLWKRNFISTPIFLWDLFKEKFRILK